MGSSDSESEDERRVVKSAKDKAQDELRAVCNEIRVRRATGWLRSALRPRRVRLVRLCDACGCAIAR